MNATSSIASIPMPMADSRTADSDALDPQDAALLEALNELLEAERAGARVAMETGRAITDPVLVALVNEIHKDEVRWCGMLMRTIKASGATPSGATGAFYGKAMAITDVDARLKFLNRGQAWVIRKLQALIPVVKDERACADLDDMLRAHQQNIERVDARYAGSAGGTDGAASR